MATDQNAPIDIRKDGASFGLAIDANSTKKVAPWADATGLCTSALRHRSMCTSRDTRTAETFLINSRLVRNRPQTALSIANYFNDAITVALSMAGRELVDESKVIPLPDNIALDMPLEEAILRRRSVRKFTGDPMELDFLATLIRATAGVTARARVRLASGTERSLHFRSAPTAGGLYPAELYVAAVNVKGLEPGVYRYNAVQDQLFFELPADRVVALKQTFAIDEQIISLQRANAYLYLVSHPWKVMRKYGDRGMRFVFMDVGYMCQNLHLAAQALGVGTVDCAAVYDDEAHEILGIDGVFRALVHSVVIGMPG